MTRYPISVVRGNYLYDYEWCCHECDDYITYKDAAGEEHCATCDGPVKPVLKAKKKIDPTIPDEEPDPDMPF
jgi:hypothetical protein